MPFPRMPSPLAGFLLAAAAVSSLAAQISIQITVGPPPIPVYEQPMLPEDGFVWTPGYWAWGEEGYFWVPGTWVQVPETGLVWTPGYWGWGSDTFVFHSGYWGTHVGFYGGINYGHGYGGDGYDGGYWQGRNYYYNRSVTHVNVTRVTNVYNRTVIVNNPTTIAYNGGAGGLRATPTLRERSVETERHAQPTALQVQHRQLASENRDLRVSANRGKPPVGATERPADFSPSRAVAARAPGGMVPEATLKATPKTLERPPRNLLPEARPGRMETAPTPERRPAPAPTPIPQRRPEPAPAQGTDRHSDPGPKRRPEPVPAPLPERRPMPAPIPRGRPEPAPAPAPERQPRPAPAPQRRPEPAPVRGSERPPATAPHPDEKPRPKPVAPEGREPRPKPEPPNR